MTYGFETELIAPLAKLVPETIHWLSGASFDQKKLQLSSLPVVLGVTFNLEDFLMEIKEERKRELIESIDAILESGALDPGTAGKLNGKLMFGASQLWGKVGRAFFRPISERQYSKDLSGDRMDLNEALKRSLIYCLKARRVRFLCAPPRGLTL